MNRLLAGAAILAVLAGASPARPSGPPRPTAAQQGHCRASETVVYSCRFGAKHGSVCAMPGGIAYRFGRLGKPEMQISSAPDWDNVRLGWVVGQQGGHQHHIRFTNGVTHYIVFEGEDGQLAQRPGRTYSGIAIVRGSAGERELGRLDCKAVARAHPDFISAVTAIAPKHLRDRLDEEKNGPFEAWF